MAATRTTGRSLPGFGVLRLAAALRLAATWAAGATSYRRGLAGSSLTSRT